MSSVWRIHICESRRDDSIQPFSIKPTTVGLIHCHFAILSGPLDFNKSRNSAQFSILVLGDDILKSIKNESNSNCETVRHNKMYATNPKTESAER